MSLLAAWQALSYSAGATVELLGVLLIFVGCAIGASGKNRNRRTR